MSSFSSRHTWLTAAPSENGVEIGVVFWYREYKIVQVICLSYETRGYFDRAILEFRDFSEYKSWGRDTNERNQLKFPSLLAHWFCWNVINNHKPLRVVIFCVQRSKWECVGTNQIINNRQWMRPVRHKSGRCCLGSFRRQRADTQTDAFIFSCPASDSLRCKEHCASHTAELISEELIAFNCMPIDWH